MIITHAESFLKKNIKQASAFEQAQKECLMYKICLLTGYFRSRAWK
jgi:hypothetical protein